MARRSGVSSKPPSIPRSWKVGSGSAAPRHDEADWPKIACMLFPAEKNSGIGTVPAERAEEPVPLCRIRAQRRMERLDRAAAAAPAAPGRT